ncbi:hypothetical protein ACO0LC_15810 [Undibacterium sp. JH2W]|uniref:hypothetical protein n=1 Tax=Undibacterium sp. JH2W TaxID=3413037 RepID=UPI003BF3CE8F
MNACLFIIFSLGLIWGTWLIISSKTLRARPSDIQVIIYFFSLAFVVSMVLIWWAYTKGVFLELKIYDHSSLDSASKVVLTWPAQVIHWLREIVLDAVFDFIVIGVLVSIVIVPQFISYILCGCVGHAWQPRLVSCGMSFFVWGIIKFFTVFSGVAMSVAAWVYFGKIFNDSPSMDFLLACLGLFAAFGIILTYRMVEEIGKYISERCPKWISKTIAFLHLKATRNNS